MKVEVQLRTLAMDVWASMEHKISYKRDLLNEATSARIKERLLECAAKTAEIDRQMEVIRAWARQCDAPSESDIPEVI